MVLDEADEMLNMGFVKDVTKIIESTPSDRQLVLFSATTNQDVLTIAWKYQHDPVEITVEATKADRPQITQYVIATEQDCKTDNLLYLLDANVYQRIMIFCNTKFMTDKLTSRLIKEGYNALRHTADEHIKAEVAQQFSGQSVTEISPIAESLAQHRNGCLVAQSPSEFFIIHREKSDTLLFTWNRDVLRVLFDADERACFNVIVTAILNKVLDSLSGKGTFLHLVENNDRLPFLQHHVV